MSTPLLEGTALARTFPSRGGRDVVAALRGVDVRLAPGERLALIGCSGSGKTTLLRILLALERPTAGTVRCDSRPVQPGRVSRLRWYRRLVQYVPQDPAGSLDPRMTIEQLVTDPLRRLQLPGDHRRLALEALERVHLTSEFLHRRRAEISGGQAQRVASKLRTKRFPANRFDVLTTANQAGVDGVEYWLTGVAGLAERPYLQKAKPDEGGDLIPAGGSW
ncbi:ATP-binding cassette domain-containing protein [Brachybacterium huguangmaarense]|uniref:ATP-binding cassette domain-containing protein n=1 Tax=Brachybacterium huguangmaarense TaxID=1652028 RepID=A0ABY6G1I8_9MICO|nr:ATP-binding cassette domain-containing protein [Brachybacterium huguangmaarense]UYG17060.1 ATP-binding cassette domain-containing protein [Brachybacterium huguangmaarense]